jgi:hypothetical protein
MISTTVAGVQTPGLGSQGSASPCVSCGALNLERTRFFPRQIVGPDDLTQDQIYFRDKLRRHNRLLHGWGVVCGARVRNGPGKCEVIVESGYILGPYGDEIVIGADVTVDLCSEGLDGNAVSACGDLVDPWCSNVRIDRPTGLPLYLAARYDECQTRPVQVAGCACGCDGTDCQYSRICDSYCIKVLTALPASYNPMPKPIPPFGEVRCQNLACPPCPADPWVILADITLTPDGGIQSIDCFTHRRLVATFAEFYYLCPAPVSLASLTVDPSTFQDPPQGAEAKGTVTLTGAAPPGGAIVALSSSSNLVTVPATATVAAGETTSQPFLVTLGQITSFTQATITAGYNNTQKTAQVTINVTVIE